MKILFIGGDARMGYAANALSSAHEITFFAEQPAGRFDAVVFPLPLTRDGRSVAGAPVPLLFDELLPSLRNCADENTIVFAGGETPALTAFCAEIGCKFVNYFASETLTLQNAALTAEAALCLLSQSTDGALLGSDTLITGSGRIAQFLATRLRVCGSNVTITARNRDKREFLKLNGYSTVAIDELQNLPFDYIVNTVPAQIFDEVMFSKARNSAVFMELALSSDPYKPFAERYDIKYISAGGLPGKYSPKTAGEFIARAIGEQINRSKL